MTSQLPPDACSSRLSTRADRSLRRLTIRYLLLRSLASLASVEMSSLVVCRETALSRAASESSGLTVSLLNESRAKWS